MRKDTNSNIDSQVFRRTAAHGKAINLSSRIFRGGTRL